MGYRRRAVIFRPEFQTRIAGRPLVVADVGARGILGRPWRDLATLRAPALHLVGFEPDRASQDLVGAHAVRTTVIKRALWSEAGAVPLSRAGSRSSVHPPDMEAASHFEQRHMRARRPRAVTMVPAVTLDHALDEHQLSVDAIKCDTQGSEYEILAGATRQLAQHVVLVIAETWTWPVHRGQQLSYTVEQLLVDAGFEIMERQLHGRWGRESDRGLVRRRQETSFDVLFLVSIDNLLARRPDTATLLKAAGLADLYGFVGYALDLLSAARQQPGVEAEALDWMTTTIRHQRRRGAVGTANDAVALALRRLARWHDARRWPPLSG